MARRVSTERYEVIGARSRARRFAVVCGECRSGLREISAHAQRLAQGDMLLRELQDFGLSEGKDLVDILQSVRVTAEG